MRKIDSIIVHCADTPEGKDFTVQDIDRWHRQRGWKCIGYHFIIYRDGTVEAGRPVEDVGAHCEGHNATSIGICYIGGKGADGKPKDTRTDAQHASLVDLCFILMQNHHINLEHIFCHNDFSQKACPCFDHDSLRKEIYNYAIEL